MVRVPEMKIKKSKNKNKMMAEQKLQLREWFRVCARMVSDRNHICLSEMKKKKKKAPNAIAEADIRCLRVYMWI